MEAKERAEICIIGGGIYGLVIAFHLVEAGKDVLVVDQGPIAMEALCLMRAPWLFRTNP